ncbi:MAG: MmcQ/YjbR family DNA-binding protein [Clostridia bacterium]|nr:MmcQ/YjbR family DNA-binding protein [Clostridia bacterium]
MKQQVIDYIKDKYSVSPDYPFDEDNMTAVFRNPKNDKWFGIIMCSLPLSKIGGKGEKRVDVINLKCDPLLQYTLLDGKTIFKAYHMNKEHWITVLLDGSADFDKLAELINMSYDLIEKKTKKIKTKAPKYEDMW